MQTYLSLCPMNSWKLSSLDATGPYGVQTQPTLRITLTGTETLPSGNKLVTELEITLQPPRESYGMLSSGQHMLQANPELSSLVDTILSLPEGTLKELFASTRVESRDWELIPFVIWAA